MEKQILKAFYGRFPDERTCVAYLEKVRWPNGRECPHCGSAKTYKFRYRLLFKCSECKRQFTVRAGTAFARSHVPLQEWFLAVHLLTVQKQAVSSIQLTEYLEVTQKTAWHMLKCIRDWRAGSEPTKAEISFEDVLKQLVAAPEPGLTK